MAKRSPIVIQFVVAVFNLVIGAAFLADCRDALAQGAAPKAAARPTDDLVAKAKKEGEVSVAVVSQIGPVARDLERAFKKRFGLESLQMNFGVGDQPAQFAQLKANLSAGMAPAFDALTGTDEEILQVVAAGHTAKTQDWEKLLAEVNPLIRSGAARPAQVSTTIFSGEAFIWGNRLKALIYNPKLISENELPKTHADLAAPKFKGKYVVAPWTDEWEMGVLVYKDKSKWLEILDQIGQNARGVVHLTAATGRLLLGEFPFFPGNEYYSFTAKAKDPKAPIAYHFWSDYTGLTRLYYIVPAKARHPAAGTLFALWMTTPEAQAIYQPVAHITNVSYGQSDHDKGIRAAIDKVKTPVISYWDSEENLTAFKWYSSDEGRKYLSELV